MTTERKGPRSPAGAKGKAPMPGRAGSRAPARLGAPGAPRGAGRPGGAPRSGSGPATPERHAGLHPAVLAAAIELIERVLKLAYPADSALSQFFREQRTGGRDRAFMAELAFAILRRKRSLEAALARHPNPDSKATHARNLALVALARVQGWSLRQLEPVLHKKEAEWLAAVAHETVDETTLPLGERLDLPDWLAERLLPTLGEERLSTLVRALNRPAPLDLRVNVLKGTREQALAALAAEGIHGTPCPLSPVGIRLKHKPALNKSPAYLDGLVEVQDEGSQLLPLLLAPRRGEMVVDFCAGAGGKTLQIGAMMRSTGRLYAFDVSEKRLAKLKPRAARAGLSNVHPVVIDSEADQRVKRLAGKLDRVLVDAPCSGLGTLRRNPDLKWRQSAQSVTELVAKQQAILVSAASLVKPGGRLVYATCSILAEENEGVVESFLTAHPEFVRLPAGEILASHHVTVGTPDGYLRLDPATHACDGFFAAVLERKAAA